MWFPFGRGVSLYPVKYPRKAGKNLNPVKGFGFEALDFLDEHDGVVGHERFQSGGVFLDLTFLASLLVGSNCCFAEGGKDVEQATSGRVGGVLGTILRHGFLL